MAVNIKKYVGSRVREARDAAGLTQEALAEQANKTTATISNLERGTVMTSLTTLDDIGSCLGVPLAYFFEGVSRSRKLTAHRVQAESQISAVVTRLSDDQLDMVAFFILAVQLFITVLEFKLTTLAGFVLVPFALWNKSSFLAERVLGNVISSGIKVMVLAVIVGIGASFFSDFINALIGQEPNLAQAMSLEGLFGRTSRRASSRGI